MRYLPIAAAIIAALAASGIARAWDGFDAGTTELVEITPGKVPGPGDAVDVRSYDTEESQTCLVESVRRNRRTIEVVVKDPTGARRILVMENI